MAYGQNGNKSKWRQVKTATEMAIFKTATDPNNTYSSRDAYIIDVGCTQVYDTLDLRQCHISVLFIYYIYKFFLYKETSIQQS